jgi:hypothetical protein
MELALCAVHPRSCVLRVATGSGHSGSLRATWTKQRAFAGSQGNPDCLRENFPLPLLPTRVTALGNISSQYCLTDDGPQRARFSIGHYRREATDCGQGATGPRYGQLEVNAGLICDVLPCGLPLTAPVRGEQAG